MTFDAAVRAWFDGQLRAGFNRLLEGAMADHNNPPTPAWVTAPRDKLWEEDDCTLSDPGHETLKVAHRRLALGDFDPSKALEKYDGGDADWYLMPDGVVVLSSYPGASAIFRLRA